MSTYKPGEVAALLDIKDNTLRKWSSDNEFGQYLSTRAQGGGGSHRAYTEQDVRVLTLVAEMKQQNSSQDDIHASLKSLRSAGWAGLPDIPAVPPGIEPVSMIPREAAETKIDQQRGALMREISVLQERLEDLEERLQGKEEENAELLKERATLMQRVGELQGQLSERRSMDFWLRIVAVVIVVAVVLTVVLLLLARS